MHIWSTISECYESVAGFARTVAAIGLRKAVAQLFGMKDMSWFSFLLFLPKLIIIGCLVIIFGGQVTLFEFTYELISCKLYFIITDGIIKFYSNCFEQFFNVIISAGTIFLLPLSILGLVDVVLLSFVGEIFLVRKVYLRDGAYYCRGIFGSSLGVILLPNGKVEANPDIMVDGEISGLMDVNSTSWRPVGKPSFGLTLLYNVF